MHMRRFFLPVGQGAFYLERFWLPDKVHPINVVYDCGSLSGKEILLSVIHDMFHRGEEIAAVFLSHLHEDHVNGLPMLLQHCHVRKVYFPEIEKEDIPLLQLQNRANDLAEEASSQQLLQSLPNPRDPFDLNSETMWISVREANKDIDNEDDNRRKFPQSLSQLCDQSLSAQDDDWLFVPFNFRRTIIIDQLKEALGELLHQDPNQLTNKTLLDYWDKNAENRRRIKRIFLSIAGEFNTNSMTLYSGRMSNNGFQIAQHGHHCLDPFRPCCCFPFHHYWLPFWDRPNFKAAGCLYTGDYNASGSEEWKTLKEHYQRYWDLIGCIQIPHHGSQHNFNDEFCKHDAYFVISAGLGNQYKHPSADVLAKLYEKGPFPAVVTQDPFSTFETLVASS